MLLQEKAIIYTKVYLIFQTKRIQKRKKAQRSISPTALVRGTDMVGMVMDWDMVMVMDMVLMGSPVHLGDTTDHMVFLEGIVYLVSDKSKHNWIYCIFV